MDPDPGTQGITVRPLDPADRDDVSSVIELDRAFTTEFFPDRVWDGDGRERELCESLARGERVVVACDGERVIGAAWYRFTRDRWSGEQVCRLSFIAVDRDARNKGVGRSLMDHVKADAQHEGCSVLEVSVNYGNDRAAGFYELCGFVPARRVLRLPLKTKL